MKYLIIIFSLCATTAYAWEPARQYGSNQLSHDEVMRGGMGLEPYSAYDGVRRTRRNIFGGEDYYGTRGYMGRTIPNLGGGRTYYPSYDIGM